MMVKLSNEQPNSEIGWVFIKVCFAYYWFADMDSMVHYGGNCPHPIGICRLYNFNPLFNSYGPQFTMVIVFIALVFYAFEKYMLPITGLLTIVSCIIISHHESSGVSLRATPYTTVWGAQFLAYLAARLIPDFDLRFYRQNLPVQMIAATYTLAAIGKLRSSGLGWIQDGTNFLPIEMIKGFSYHYFDTGDTNILKAGYVKADFMMKHHAVLKFFLTSSLVLETFCFVAVINPTVRLFYGICLLLMHAGIFYYMDIMISGLLVPMVIFFVNPANIIYNAFVSIV